MSRLCATCRAERDRWLDTTPAIVRPGVRIASGAAYDDTPGGVRDNVRARWEDWRRLVNRQRQDIKDQCLREDHAGLRATYEQGDLFVELLEAS